MQKANVSSVKYQVCRLIRMLVHICKTLDSMPPEVGLQRPHKAQGTTLSGCQMCDRQRAAVDPNHDAINLCASVAAEVCQAQVVCAALVAASILNKAKAAKLVIPMPPAAKDAKSACSGSCTAS